MKKFLVAILAVGLFGFAAQAQTGWNWDSQQYYGQSSYQPSVADTYKQGGQVPVYNLDPSVCFEPGWDFGGYFSVHNSFLHSIQRIVSQAAGKGSS